MQETFLQIFDEQIRREGAAELRAYLLRSDFFRAPASTHYHCAYEGGLCEHSVNTYRRLLKNVQNEYGAEWEQKFSHETVAICGLLHDLCKIDFYKQDFRNVKENGEWSRRKVGVHHQRISAPDARRSRGDQLAHGRIRFARARGRRFRQRSLLQIPAGSPAARIRSGSDVHRRKARRMNFSPRAQKGGKGGAKIVDKMRKKR